MHQFVVAIEACSSYDASLVDKAVAAACSEAGMPDVTGKRVLIKPNILSDVPPERAVTTHPAILSSVIRVVLERGGLPLVGDSPAIHGSGFNAERSGIRQVCDREGARWLDFSRGTVRVRNTGSGKIRWFNLSSAIEQCDMILSLPKLKTHQLMYMTGAVKNLFGLVPGIAKSPYHLRFADRNSFSEMLLDLYATVAPRFSLMDAVIAMEGPGPNSGRPKYLGIVLASRSGLALDFAASQIMGYEPESVPLLHRAFRRGLLNIDRPDDVLCLPRPPSAYRPRSFELIEKEKRRSVLQVALGFLHHRKNPMKAAPKPLITAAACTGCSLCVEICPAEAVRVDTGSNLAIINYHACIRCYCCHEVCPSDAITIEQNPHHERTEISCCPTF